MSKPRRKDSRPYITVTNELFRHPKFLAIGERARLYLIELWGHCNEFKTDGQVSPQVLKARGPKVARDLIDAGWVEEHDDGTLWMHDYLDHQPSKTEIQERIQDKRERASVGGRKSAHVRHHEQKGVNDPQCPWCRPNPAEA